MKQIITIFVIMLLGTLTSYGYKTGKLTVDVKYPPSAGTPYKVDLYVPSSYNPDMMYPLILCIPDTNQSGTELRDWFINLSEARNVIIACLDSGIFVYNKPPDLSYSVVTPLREMYNIDTTATYLCGYKSGSSILDFSKVHIYYDDFQGGLAISPDFNWRLLESGGFPLYQWDQPYAMIIGDKDTNSQNIIQCMKYLGSKGYTMKLLTKQGVERDSDPYWGTDDFENDILQMYDFMAKRNMYIRLTPESLSHVFPTTEWGDTVVHKFVFKNTGHQDLHDVWIDLYKLPSYINSSDRTQFDLKMGDTAQFEIVFTPHDYHRYYTYMNVQAQNKYFKINLKIEFFGNGIYSGSILQLDSNFSTFPPTQVGFESEKSIQMYNYGNLPLLIDSIQIENDTAGVFYPELAKFPISIDSITSMYYSVVFSPVREGKYSALLRIYSNAASSPDSVILSAYAYGETGVENDNLPSNLFNIHPNPVRDNLNLQSEITNGTVTISDFTGNMIQKLNIRDRGVSGSIVIPLSEYSAGIYFLVIESGGKRYVRQIIKVE